MFYSPAAGGNAGNRTWTATTTTNTGTEAIVQVHGYI